MNTHEYHLTITTLNVLHNPIDRAPRARLAGAALKRTDPDIVLLQELPFERFKPDHPEVSSAYLDAFTAETGLQAAFATPMATYDFRDGSRGAHCVGILHSERLVLRESGELPMHPDLEGFTPYVMGAWALFDDPTGRAVAVLNLHGTWGGHNVRLREKQILHADRFAGELEARLKAEGRDPLIVLGGDLNTEPDSTPIRFLTGVAPIQDSGTYWVDAWTAAGDGTGGHTSITDNYWFRRTALGVGIDDPGCVPSRRVDYLFVRGWAYGRRGNPVKAYLDACDLDNWGRHASDHLAVTAVLHPGAAALREIRQKAQAELVLTA